MIYKSLTGVNQEGVAAKKRVGETIQVPFLNHGRNTLELLLRSAAVGLVLLAMLACGDSGDAPQQSPTAPPGMFSTLPTREAPVVGDQPPTIDLNRAEPTVTPQPTPTPNPTYTPEPTPTPLPTPTPYPTGTPAPTLTTNLTGTPVPTATPQRTYTPHPTSTQPATEPTSAPAPTPTVALIQAPIPRPTAQPVAVPVLQATSIPVPATIPTVTPTKPTTIVPGSPASLSARADGETEIDLSWGRPSSDGGSRITGYRIEMSEDGSGWSVLQADTSRTRHTHRGLSSGSTRYYRVSAINSAGTGQPSNIAHATTDSVDVPGAPQSLSARADGETEIDLSWSRPSNDGGSRVTGYRIEVSEDGSGWSVLDDDTSRTSHTHRGLSSGSTRYYRVSAINSAGTGPPSNTAHATTDSVDVPGAPQSLSARADGETEIDLSWSRPSNDGGSRITGYRIEVSDNGSNWSVLEPDTSRTRHTHRGLPSGSTRYYRVSAVNSAGTGPHSNTANATTDSVNVPVPPTSLSARADGETEIDLSWSRPSSDGGSRITGYRIEVSEDGSGWNVLEADTGSSRTSHTHRELSSGSTRYYRVSAINSAGTGQPSNTANATTDSVNVPGPPTSLSAWADGDTEINLSWGRPSSDGGSRITGYRVEVSEDGSGWSVLEADTGSSRTSHNHRGLSSGSTRHYRVSAINSAGTGPHSNTANATTAAHCGGYRDDLFGAIGHGNTDIVQCVVDAGADVDAKDADGDPILILAIGHGNVEMVRIIVSDGQANVDAKDADGDPILIRAIGHGNAEMVRIIVSDGQANVDAKDADGDPILIRAIGHGNAEIVQIIVSDGQANVDAKDADGDPILIRAIGHHNAEIVRIIVSADANVNAITADGERLLTVAKKTHNAEIIKILEDAGATEE